MQNRMKNNSMTKEQTDRLLERSQTGSLATINPDGSPYVIPVHFVYCGDTIFVHCAPKGQKLDNIRANPCVSMTVYEMEGLLLSSDENPCRTNTKYQSAVITGSAVLQEDFQIKKEALSKIVEKYTPHLADREMPEKAIQGTAVIAIRIETITGKYYG